MTALLNAYAAPITFVILAAAVLAKLVRGALPPEPRHVFPAAVDVKEFAQLLGAAIAGGLKPVVDTAALAATVTALSARFDSFEAAVRDAIADAGRQAGIQEAASVRAPALPPPTGGRT